MAKGKIATGSGGIGEVVRIGVGGIKATPVIERGDIGEARIKLNIGNGGVETVIRNGAKLTKRSKIALLLEKVENVGGFRDGSDGIAIFGEGGCITLIPQDIVNFIFLKSM